MNRRLRTGRKVKRTIYVQNDLEPSDNDLLIGVLDEGWGPMLVHAFNAWLADAVADTHSHFWTYRSSFGDGWRECPCGVKQETDQ